MEWLNRAGIILNFVAGFLLAPELIGIERLQKLENKIEEKIDSLEKKLRPTQDYKEGLSQKERFWIKLSAIGFLGAPTLYIVSIVAFPVLLGFSCYYLYGLIFFPKHPFALNLLFLIIGLIASTFIIVIGSVFFLAKDSKTLRERFISIAKQLHMMGFGFLLMEILVPIYSLLVFFVKFFKKQDTLLNIFLWLGIVFFVLGNFLQLIATF